MGGITGVLAVALFLATFIEWFVERFLAPIPKLKGWPLVFSSAAVAILLAWAFKLDLIGLAGIEDMQYPATVGYIMTGVILGSGSNAIHFFIKQARR